MYPSVKAAAKKEAEKKKKADKKAKEEEEEEAAAAAGKLSPITSSDHLLLSVIFTHVLIPFYHYITSTFFSQLTLHGLLFCIFYSTSTVTLSLHCLHPLLHFYSAAAAAVAAVAASGPVDLSLLSAEEREKRAKAIRKKLKAVEEVKEKQSAGQKLDAGQVSKTLLLRPDCFHPFHLFFLSHLTSSLPPLIF